MRISEKKTIHHKIVKHGVEVMYDNSGNDRHKEIWVCCNGLYDWMSREQAMQLVKGILKMRSDLKKVGVNL